MTNLAMEREHELAAWFQEACDACNVSFGWSGGMKNPSPIQVSFIGISEKDDLGKPLKGKFEVYWPAADVACQVDWTASEACYIGEQYADYFQKNGGGELLMVAHEPKYINSMFNIQEGINTINKAVIQRTLDSFQKRMKHTP